MYVRCPTNPRRRKTPEDRRIDAPIVEQLFLGASSDSRAISKVGAWTRYGPFGALYFWGTCYLLTKERPAWMASILLFCEKQNKSGHLVIAHSMNSVHFI